MNERAPGPEGIPEDLFERLVESVSAVTYVMRFGHADEPPLYVSPQCEAVIGLLPETIMVDARGRNQLLHPEDRERIWEHATLLDATGGDWDEEYRLIQPDGTFRWVHDQARVVPEAPGRPALWFGVLTDLTRTNDAERALADSEMKYRALVEQVPVEIYIDTYEERPTTLYVSPFSEELSGYLPQEWIDDPDLWMRVVHPDDQHLFTQEWPADLDGEDRSTWEYRVFRKDGHMIWVKDVARLIRSEEGTPLFWQGVILDITEQRESEERLRNSEARYRTLVEDIPAYVYIATDEPDPTMSYVSPQVLEILGYAPELWTEDQDLWWKVMPAEHGRRVLTDWETCVRDRTAFSAEYPANHRDGRTVWLRDVARLVLAADGVSSYWHGVVLDVTDSKMAEEALRESEGRYRLLVEHVPALVYIDSNDEDPASMYLSPNVVELLGHTPEEYTEHPDRWGRTVHPDDWDRVHEHWREAVRTGEGFQDEYRFVRPDGRVVWVVDDALLVRTPEGTPLHWQGVIRDITQRKLAEEALQRSNARFRALVEQSPAVVYEMSLDDERQTLYVSPQVEALFGYSTQEWLDQPDIWTELLHPEDREVELAAHDLHNQTGEPWSQEYRLIASDGHVVWVRDQAVLVRDHTGQPPRWQGIMLDITSQKELEERLRLTNDELELRVNERTAELAEANEMMALEIGERQRIQTELSDAHERYRKLVEDVPAVVYIWQVGGTDPTDPRAYTSPRVEHMLGYTAEEWEQAALREERVHPHDRERVLAAAEHSATTGEPFEQEYRILAKDGRPVWVLNHATLLTRDRQGEPELFQGVLLDITSRKAAEQKAQEAEDHLRTLTEMGPEVSYIYELERVEPQPIVRLIYASPHISELLGRSIGERFTVPQQLMSIVHPDDRERMLAEFAEQWQTGADYDRELRVIASDGRVIWLHNKGRCIARDELGRPSRFHAVLLDVTRQKEEEERLRQSETQLRTLVESLPGMPWIEIADEEPGRGRLVYLGDQVEEILGYTAEELLAEPAHFERLVHPADRDRINALAAHHDVTGEPWRTQYRAQTRDGRIRWLWSEGAASRDDQGRLVWTGISFDVTAMHTEDEEVTTVPDAVEQDH